MTLTKDRAAELRAAHPEWAIWQSGIGRWWGTREGNISLSQRDHGVVASLDADEFDELADLIRIQERLRRTAA
jgi:hypothetical protein